MPLGNYRWEPPVKSRYNFSSLPRTQRVRRLVADARFRLITDQQISPVELVPTPTEARLWLCTLHGKRFVKWLRTEMHYYGFRRGRHRVYVAQMSINRMTSQKIKMIHKLVEKSRSHKAFLLVTRRPTRTNYQADPAVLEELAHHLGRHHRCQVFSWDQEPSDAQLAALMGLMLHSVQLERLAVPTLRE